MPLRRRPLLVAAFGALAAAIGLPALAQARRAIAAMTEGPFYPPRAWRDAHWPDQDADLTRVGHTAAARRAQGEHLGLELRLADTDGRTIDGAAIEIWQCDALQAYRHPGVALAAGRHDPAFQGFGATTTDAGGMARLRTIKPVPYPGRTPHIHVKLRHASFGELTSQLFVAGDPGNERDFLWRALPPADREALALRLTPSDTDNGLRWMARHVLTVGR
jgi:protocatechuate 3,4-dioxygenase beta subunit